MPILQRFGRRDFESFYAAGHWTRDTLLDALAAHAAAAPDRLALVDGARRVSRVELAALVDAAAHRLVREGVRPEDVVAVQLPNSIHLVVVCLALLRVGAVYHPLNTSYRQNDVLNILKTSRPPFYVHTRRFKSYVYEPLLDGVQADGGLSFRRILVDVDRPAEEAFGTPEATSELPPADPDALFLLGATSGSTGDPKLFMHTQNTQFNEARSLNAAMGLEEEDPFLAFAPITHRGALMWGLVQAIAAGAPLILQREYNPDAIVELIEREQVATFFAIPNQLVDFLDTCARNGRRADSLRVVMLAGAPVQPELVARVRDQWPNCAPVTGYGTSETGYATVTRPTDPLEVLQTSGRPIPGMEIAVDRTGTAEGNSGEFVFRGAFVSAGYYANQPATDLSFNKEGWFHTGDLGYLDENGNVRVTGRIKNVIIRSGLKIQAEEVEEVLLRHPAIAHAVIVGMRDPQVGERAVACLIPRGEKTLSLPEVTSFLDQEGLGKFKWPEVVRTFTELPLNANGKFDRIVLRAQINAPAETHAQR
ncbi:class I adenylate-forming enzyme family protein [Enterovirga sp. CN4-39]|uniref:class I adenylate-forming enzyme family protein n=1 Tax=Enterovirga sp. CN4-39 TaxID=3400910 RepID=UPI003C075A1E